MCWPLCMVGRVTNFRSWQKNFLAWWSSWPIGDPRVLDRRNSWRVRYTYKYTHTHTQYVLFLISLQALANSIVFQAFSKLIWCCALMCVQLRLWSFWVEQEARRLRKVCHIHFLFVVLKMSKQINLMRHFVCSQIPSLRVDSRALGYAWCRRVHYPRGLQQIWCRLRPWSCLVQG